MVRPKHNSTCARWSEDNDIFVVPEDAIDCELEFPPCYPTVSGVGRFANSNFGELSGQPWQTHKLPDLGSMEHSIGRVEEQLVAALIQQSDELRELKAELALLKEQFETQGVDGTRKPPKKLRTILLDFFEEVGEGEDCLRISGVLTDRLKVRCATKEETVEQLKKGSTTDKECATKEETVEQLKKGSTTDKNELSSLHESDLKRKLKKGSTTDKEELFSMLDSL